MTLENIRENYLYKRALLDEAESRYSQLALLNQGHKAYLAALRNDMLAAWERYAQAIKDTL